MKKAIVVRVAQVGIFLYFGVWLAASLYAKKAYEKVRAEINASHVTVAQIGQKERSFLSEVESNWVCKGNVTNGPSATATENFGLSPSVANLIEVQTYQMPKYSWFSTDHVREAAVKGITKSLANAMGQAQGQTQDLILYVAESRNLAFFRCKPGQVMIFRDVGVASLGEAFYVDTNASSKTTRPANKSIPVEK